MCDWANLLLEVGSEEGHWDKPEIVQREDRFWPGDGDVEELLVSYV